MSTRPFAPYAHGNTVKVSGSTTSAAGTLPSLNGSQDLRIYNASSAIAFVRWQNASGPTATTSDIPIPAGGVEVFEANGAQYVAVILSTGTGDVYFTSGRGL